MYLCIYVYMYIYIHTCVCICMYVCIYVNSQIDKYDVDAIAAHHIYNVRETQMSMIMSICLNLWKTDRQTDGHAGIVVFFTSKANVCFI